MADDGDVLEQTLHIAREVDVYQIPPRPPTGHSSGTWMVGSKIFTGRLRVVSIGVDCEVRLESPDSDQLFACCPIKYGMRNVCVEPAMDSSRYFVLRVEDPTSKRHAFLGIGFQQRGDAFDFNEALIRHEKFAERERAASQLTSAGSAGSDPSSSGLSPGARRTTPTQSAQATAAAQELASLYASKGDLSLKAGQTIHVSVKPGGTKASTGMAAAGAGTGGAAGNGAAGSSWLTAVPVAPAPGGAGLFKLAPPPADAAVRSQAAPAPPAPTAWQPQQPLPQAPQAAIDLLSWDAPAPAAQNGQSSQVAKPAAAPAPSTDAWAVFD